MKIVRRILRGLPWVVLGTVLLSVAMLALVRIEQTIEAAGEVRIRSYRIIRPRVAGTIVEVAVQPGDRVERHQLLVQLRDFDLQDEMAVSRQQLADATTRRGELRSERTLLAKGVHPRQRLAKQQDLDRGDLETAAGRTRIAEIEIQLQIMMQRLQRTERLSREGLLSAQALEEAGYAKLEAEKRYERAKLEDRIERDRHLGLRHEIGILEWEQRLALARLDAALEGTDHQVARWSTRLEQIEALLESHKIRSTMAGVVIGVPANELLGRTVEAGEKLFTVVDVESILFRTQVPDHSIIRVRRGQKAKVEIVGLPSQRFDLFPGRVSKVAQELELPDDQGPILYPVEIQLDTPWVDLDDGRFFLRNGMRGSARISYRSRVPAFRVLYDFLVGEERVRAQRAERRRDSRELAGGRPRDDVVGGSEAVR